MKKRNTFLFGILLLSTFLFNAQDIKFKIESGQASGLENASIGIFYDYTNLVVNEFKNEEEFLKYRQENLKEDPKKFEEIKRFWYDNRKSRYEPKFEQIFNKNADYNISAVNYNEAANVKLTVQLLRAETNFLGGTAETKAFCDFRVTFSDKEGKPIVIYTMKNVPGSTDMNYNFGPGAGITESFAKAAKILVKDVNYRIKKSKQVGD